MAKITKLEIKVNDGKELEVAHKMEGGTDVDFPVIAKACDAAMAAFCAVINKAS